MDIGATNNVHTNAGILNIDLNKLDTHLVLVGNGSCMHVVMTGHTSFPCINLYHPLYLNILLITPSIIKNIIYVHQFIKHDKCYIEFDNLGFIFIDYWTHRPLLRCNCNDHFYLVTPSTLQEFVSSSPPA